MNRKNYYIILKIPPVQARIKLPEFNYENAYKKVTRLTNSFSKKIEKLLCWEELD